MDGDGTVVNVPSGDEVPDGRKDESTLDFDQKILNLAHPAGRSLTASRASSVSFVDASEPAGHSQAAWRKATLLMLECFDGGH